jgi:hypothetical protein
MTTYACTCGRTYTSPLPLIESPKCSGVGTSRRPKHSTRTMTLKKAKAA